MFDELAKAIAYTVSYQNWKREAWDANSKRFDDTVARRWMAKICGWAAK